MPDSPEGTCRTRSPPPNGGFQPGEGQGHAEMVVQVSRVAGTSPRAATTRRGELPLGGLPAEPGDPPRATAEDLAHQTRRGSKRAVPDRRPPARTGPVAGMKPVCTTTHVSPSRRRSPRVRARLPVRPRGGEEDVAFAPGCGCRWKPLGTPAGDPDGLRAESQRDLGPGRGFRMRMRASARRPRSLRISLATRRSSNRAAPRRLGPLVALLPAIATGSPGPALKNVSITSRRSTMSLKGVAWFGSPARSRLRDARRRLAPDYPTWRCQVGSLGVPGP